MYSYLTTFSLDGFFSYSVIYPNQSGKSNYCENLQQNTVYDTLEKIVISLS